VWNIVNDTLLFTLESGKRLAVCVCRGSDEDIRLDFRIESQLSGWTLKQVGWITEEEFERRCKQRTIERKASERLEYERLKGIYEK